MLPPIELGFLPSALVIGVVNPLQSVSTIPDTPDTRLISIRYKWSMASGYFPIYFNVHCLQHSVVSRRSIIMTLLSALGNGDRYANAKAFAFDHLMACVILH